MLHGYEARPLTPLISEYVKTSLARLHHFDSILYSGLCRLYERREYSWVNESVSNEEAAEAPHSGR